MGGQHCFLFACVPRLPLEENLDVWESFVGGKVWPVSLCLRTRTTRNGQCCTPPPVELARINVSEDLACLDDLTKPCMKTLSLRSTPFYSSFLIANCSYLCARHRAMIQKVRQVHKQMSVLTKWAVI